MNASTGLTLCPTYYQKRLTRVLPKLIGPHQHGFMQKKGIQEPSLLATHLIEEAHKKEKPLQMVSFDIEKAFDKVGHSVITQALRAFGVPEIMVQALRQYTLVGFARVEVNGRKGILITIRTGSGQGDPLSSILFLLASEPLNRALVARHTNLMYITNEGLRTGPKVYADDNLLPLSLTTAQDITPVLNTYQQYTQVSGLKVNISKTAALCINTPQDIVDGIQQLGIDTPDHIKHLGIYLGKSLDDTVEETIRQIRPKAIMKRILATTPPTDILHRATLINAAFLPIYNHVFMAVPVSTEHSEALFKEVTKFLWTRQQEGQTVNKRTRVSKDRVSADIEMGGLKIAHPKELVKGFQQNLIQRILQKDTLDIPSLLPDLLQGLLDRVNRPSLDHHISHLGPVQWEITGDSLLRENTMLGQAFHAVADLLKWHETSRESWHCAAISGHTLLGDNAGMVTDGEIQLLEEAGIHTVSQLYKEEVTGQLSRDVDNDLIDGLAVTTPWVRPKLRALTNELNRLRLPLHGKQKCETVQEQQCDTKMEQKCATVNEKQCSTVDEKKCSTRMEEQCSTKNEQECSTTMEQECATIMERACETINEEKCSTVNEQQCSTVNKQQCSTVNQQKCSTVMEEQCDTKMENQCSTVNEEV